MGLWTTFLVLQPDGATFRGIFCGIVQQMKQDVRNVFLTDLGRHLGCIHSQVDVLLDLVANLIHQTLAELWNMNILILKSIVRGVLQF